MTLAIILVAILVALTAYFTLKQLPSEDGDGKDGFALKVALSLLVGICIAGIKFLATDSIKEESCFVETVVDEKHRGCTKGPRVTTQGGEVIQSYGNCGYTDQSSDYLLKDDKLCPKSIGRRIGEKASQQ